MKTLLGTCFFLALLSPVAPLTCAKCWGMSGECEVDYEECADDQEVCLTMQTDIRLADNDTSLLYMGCARKDECDYGTFGLTVSRGRYSLTQFHCCWDDNCNEFIRPLPPHDDLPPNRLTCPACLALGQDNCHSDGSIECLGNEKYCVNMVQDISIAYMFNTTFVAQGCATKDLCNHSEGERELINGVITWNIRELMCFPARPNENDSYPDYQSSDGQSSDESNSSDEPDNI